MAFFGTLFSRSREGRFEVREGVDGFFFSYISSNNKEMFTSTLFTRHNNVKRALKSLSKQLEFASPVKVVDYWSEETYFV